MFGRDVFDRVSFVENNEIVFKKDAAARFVFDAAEVHEEERMVEHQHVSLENFGARALKKAGAKTFGVFGTGAAKLRRTKTALGTNLLPDFRVRLDFKVREAPVFRELRPFEDALQLLDFR